MGERSEEAKIMLTLLIDSPLRIQKYITSENITVEGMQALFSYRTRMGKFLGNFERISVFPLCENQSDARSLIHQ